MRMHEELKKISDREFKNFQEANDLLSKMAVYAVSIAGKFELVHVPEFEDAKKAASLYFVMAIAFLLSQICFAAFVYASWVGSKGGFAYLAAPPPSVGYVAAASAVRGREPLANAASIKVVPEMIGEGYKSEKNSKEPARSLN